MGCTWQCDALDKVMHLARWCTLQCDTLGKVMHLTRWPMGQWWCIWQKMISLPRIPSIFTDFRSFTVSEFRCLSYKTVNYWQCTLVTTNFLIPHFTEEEFTCWLWLKLLSINNFVPVPRYRPSPSPYFDPPPVSAPIKATDPAGVAHFTLVQSTTLTLFDQA